MLPPSPDDATCRALLAKRYRAAPWREEQYPEATQLNALQNGATAIFF